MKNKIQFESSLFAVLTVAALRGVVAAQVLLPLPQQAALFAQYPRAADGREGISERIHTPQASSFIKDYEAWKKSGAPLSRGLDEEFDSAATVLGVTDKNGVHSAYFGAAIPSQGQAAVSAGGAPRTLDLKNSAAGIQRIEAGAAAFGEKKDDGTVVAPLASARPRPAIVGPITKKSAPVPVPEPKTERTPTLKEFMFGGSDGKPVRQLEGGEQTAAVVVGAAGSVAVVTGFIEGGFALEAAAPVASALLLASSVLVAPILAIGVGCLLAWGTVVLIDKMRRSKK